MRGHVVPLRLAAFPYPGGHPWAGRPGVLYAYALVREGRTILYDTGIGFGSDWVDRTFTAVPFRPAPPPERRSLCAQ